MCPPSSFRVKGGVYVRAKPSYKIGRGHARGKNRAGDTTQRGHERMSNMKVREGAREINAAINMTGQGKWGM